MRNPSLAALLAASLFVLPALAADAPVALRKADLTLRKAGRQRAKLKGTLDLSGQSGSVDPFSDLIRVTVGGVVVVELEEDGDRRGLRSRSHGRYRFRDPDVPRKQATRLDVDLSTGSFAVSARRLDLSAVRDAGPDDVMVRVELGDTSYEFEADFRARGKRWKYRSRNTVVVPPGGGGGGGGGSGGGGDDFPPVPDGNVALTPLVNGQLSGIVGEESVVIRTQSAWDQLWLRHGVGAKPSVDFSRDMVVGIFLGNRPTSGYGASVWSVAAASGNYLVGVHENQTQGSCVIAPVITQPFALAKAPQTSGNVTFSKTTVTAICHGGP